MPTQLAGDVAIVGTGHGRGCARGVMRDFRPIAAPLATTESSADRRREAAAAGARSTCARASRAWGRRGVTLERGGIVVVERRDLAGEQRRLRRRSRCHHRRRRSDVARPRAPRCWSRVPRRRSEEPRRRPVDSARPAPRSCRARASRSADARGLRLAASARGVRRAARRPDCVSRAGCRRRICAVIGAAQLPGQRRARGGAVACWITGTENRRRRRAARRKKTNDVQRPVSGEALR